MNSSKINTYLACRLFHLQPIGIGTPYEESLASYIKRLAEAHKVLPAALIQKEILPYTNSGVHVQNLISTYPSVKINSFSTKFIDNIITILEDKTNNYDSSLLSIRKWREYLNPYNSIRKYQAWCPFCFMDSLGSEKPVYEQYIWSFQDVEICKIHQVRLVDKCPYCSSYLNPLNYSSRIGYCDGCNTWLGSNSRSGKGITQAENEWFNWAYDNIGMLFCTPPPANKMMFINNMNTLIRKFSAKKLSEELNIYPEVILRWATGKNADITNLLNLSYKLNISVHELFTQDINQYSNQICTERIILRKSRNKLDRNKMEELIDRAIEADPALTIKKLATLLHASVKSVKRLFPEKAALVKAHYTKYLLETKRARQVQIEKAIETISKKGLYPSIKALSKELGKSIWPDNDFKRIWTKTIKELGVKSK